MQPCVADLNHSLETNLHFVNKENLAYQYFNLMGVLDKKKHVNFHVDFLDKLGTLTWKAGVPRPYQEVFGLIVESYDYSSNCGTCFKHRPDFGLVLV